MNTHNPVGIQGQKNSSKQSDLFSQTGKFSKSGNRGLEQSKQAVTCTDNELTQFNSVSGKNGSGGGLNSMNQNSFKSQTLQFPNSINSQLGDDFINLFAN